MNPILKTLLGMVADPPRFLRQRVVCEDGFVASYGDLVYGVSSCGYVLSFSVGALPGTKKSGYDGFKFFKKFANAKDYSLLVFRNQNK